MPDVTLADTAVLLLVSGSTVEAAEAYCRGQGLAVEAAKQTVAAARQCIVVAAKFDRQEELGKGIKRLETLYVKALAAQEPRVALQAQREINRLLGLYPTKPTAIDQPIPEADDAAQRLALIEDYLLPLELVDGCYPVEEHARVAAEFVRTHRSV